MTGTQALIEVRGATVSRGGRRILDNVDLTVQPREIVTLVGPNGAGKSTLVKVALGLEPWDAGEVRRAPDIKIGYQPQKLVFDRSLPLSVRRFLTLTENHPPARLSEVLAEVGAPHLMDDSMHTLSGGEWQRVMLARVMLRRPHLLVLDEPTQNVDADGAAEIYRIVARLRDATGCGVLMVTHDLDNAVADRVYKLGGRERLH
jgi:zinc transport system ATP-binding protein